MRNNNTKYGDIIELPHHVSQKRPQMTLHDRAAQFSPFSALTGYEDALGETARLTNKRLGLSEDRQARINECLRIILENISERPEAKITYFVPDTLKSGGEYVTANGFVRHIDECALLIIFTDGRKIPIADIYDIEGEIFRDIENKIFCL